MWGWGVAQGLNSAVPTGTGPRTVWPDGQCSTRAGYKQPRAEAENGVVLLSVRYGPPCHHTICMWVKTSQKNPLLKYRYARAPPGYTYIPLPCTCRSIYLSICQFAILPLPIAIAICPFSLFTFTFTFTHTHHTFTFCQLKCIF